MSTRTREPVAHLKHSKADVRVRPRGALWATFMFLCVFTVSNKTYLACIISKAGVSVCRLKRVHSCVHGCVHGRVHGCKSL